MIDIALLAVVGAITWCVASEGAWGAVFMLFSVLFSGLVAMNFFEPFADFLENTISNSPDMHYRWDIIALVGLFVGGVLLLRTATEKLMPTLVLVHPLAYDATRWICGAATGYVTMAFLLTALHTAPLPREFIGFTPERQNLFNMAAPDRQWLGFTQYVSERVFPTGNIFDGPRFAVPGGYQYPENLKPTSEDKTPVWPSFAIRYAARRDELASGGAAQPEQSGAAPASSAPPPRPF